MDKVLKVMLTQEEYDTILTALKMELNKANQDDTKKLLDNALKAMYHFEITRQ